MLQILLWLIWHHWWWKAKKENDGSEPCHHHTPCVLSLKVNHLYLWTFYWTFMPTIISELSAPEKESPVISQSIEQMHEQQTSHMYVPAPTFHCKWSSSDSWTTKCLWHQYNSACHLLPALLGQWNNNLHQSSPAKFPICGLLQEAYCLPLILSSFLRHLCPPTHSSQHVMEPQCDDAQWSCPTTACLRLSPRLGFP